ncbi:MAG: hypothetical protein PHE63_10955 [Eubacteriales bacterium]|nr:hypothetical protein [Eubacteriales bacterium]MDD3198122.1 hypothetical protein [Eubacteriales bacterium]MDD3504584.1 hypothetical protein [Eubacteriales bacterium]
MKKILALTIILGLLLTVCGCGANETSSTTKLTTEAEPTKTSEVASDSEASSETDEQAESVSEATNETEEDSTNVSGSGGLKIADKSLTGIALLESIDWSMPDSYQYMAEVTNTNGETFSMVFWSDGDNIRMESDSVQDTGRSIMIYNAAEAMTYQYIEGESQGVAMSDDEEDIDDDEESGEIEGLDIEALVDDSDEYDKLIAEIKPYETGGEDALYVEMVYTEDSAEMRSVIWYSLESGFLISSEQYYAGSLISSQKIKDFVSPFKEDTSIFSPPADVEFIDYSMDDIFDQFDENMEDMEDFDLGDLEDLEDMDF